ncbi:hypothetical protein [Porphyromonas endodontalis]|uniref:hypothetical protein n=1 Tax=Porphyromonas endodontalis TaxID=28124 RepID=UPI0036107CB0
MRGKYKRVTIPTPEESSDDDRCTVSGGCSIGCVCLLVFLLYCRLYTASGGRHQSVRRSWNVCSSAVVRACGGRRISVFLG